MESNRKRRDSLRKRSSLHQSGCSASIPSLPPRKKEKIQEGNLCYVYVQSNESISKIRPCKLYPIHNTTAYKSSLYKKKVSSQENVSDMYSITSEESGIFAGTPISSIISLRKSPGEEFIHHSESILQEHWSLASSWIPVIGRSLTSALLSRDWSHREKALCRLSYDVENKLQRHPLHINDVSERLWKICGDILLRLLDDTILRVYLSALQALSTLLRHTTCWCFFSSEEEFKGLLRPLIIKIIRKCSDNKRRMWELSTWVLREIVKGPQGVFSCALSPSLLNSDVLGTMLFEENAESHWSVILGSLVFLETLLTFEEHRSFSACQILSYSSLHLSHKHGRIHRLAKKIFISYAQFMEDSTFESLWKRLDILHPSVVERCKRLLKGQDSHVFMKKYTISNKRLNNRHFYSRESWKGSIIQHNLPYDVPFEIYGIESKTYTEKQDWYRGPLLGSGGYSNCFQARDVRTGSLMAVKSISLEFFSEVEIMEIVGTHPHVLRLLGAVIEIDHCNVFTEWMAGGSVGSLLQIYGPFSEELILKYTFQLICGLEYLHRLYILHRDLKGGNLLVDTSGHQLKIGDFGSAIIIQNNLSNKHVFGGPVGDKLRGTIAFMAPEVLRGENYGLSSDIWSVGCCIIEMTTQKPPWSDSYISNHLALIYKIACSTHAPEIPSTLSLNLRDLVNGCLSLKPSVRFSSVQLLQHSSFVPNC